MTGLEFAVMSQQCAPDVHHATMAALMRVESSGNPYAIGIVGGRLSRQPKTLAEAVDTAKQLVQRGINFSAGWAQVNVKNFTKYGLTVETVFDRCTNLRAAGQIFLDCFDRVPKSKPQDMQSRLKFAASCYYSGNYRTGFDHGYVATFVAKAAKNTQH